MRAGGRGADVKPGDTRGATGGGEDKGRLGRVDLTIGGGPDETDDDGDGCEFVRLGGGKNVG